MRRLASLLALSAAVQLTLAPLAAQAETIALGMRWDAMRNIAVKAQYDSIKTTGAGQFYNPQPGFANQRVGVYSLAVDFVF